MARQQKQQDLAIRAGLMKVTWGVLEYVKVYVYVQAGQLPASTAYLVSYRHTQPRNRRSTTPELLVLSLSKLVHMTWTGNAFKCNLDLAR
jgi:hypothetical protein